MDKRLIAILIALILAGCAKPVEVPPTKIINNYCDLSEPIYLLKAEIPKLSLQTKQQIYIHNTTWNMICNKPSEKK